MRSHDAPFTPDDPDHLHAGQVWRGDDGEECTVLVVLDHSSVSRGGGLAHVQLGRDTRPVVGVDLDTGLDVSVPEAADQQYVSGRWFRGRELAGVVAVRAVTVMTSGRPRTVWVVDRDRRWVVRGGVGQFTSSPGEHP